jgi:predicted DNA-binding transcriptional regulator AlpA
VLSRRAFSFLPNVTALHHRRGALSDTPIKFLTLPDVLALIPVSRGTIHNWQRKGIFPRAQKWGGITSKRLWLESDVMGWLETRNEKGPPIGDAAGLRFDDDKNDKNSAEEMQCQTVKITIA